MCYFQASVTTGFQLFLPFFNSRIFSTFLTPMPVIAVSALVIESCNRVFCFRLATNASAELADVCIWFDCFTICFSFERGTNTEFLSLLYFKSLFLLYSKGTPLGFYQFENDYVSKFVTPPHCLSSLHFHVQLCNHEVYVTELRLSICF